MKRRPESLPYSSQKIWKPFNFPEHQQFVVVVTWQCLSQKVVVKIGTALQNLKGISIEGVLSL